MSRNPLKTKADPGLSGDNLLLTDLRNKFRHGIRLGDGGTIKEFRDDILTEVSLDNTNVTYKIGNLSENLDAQFILIDFAHSATAVTGTVKHTLKRIPVCFTTMMMSGITAGGSLAATVGNVSPLTVGAWTFNTFQVSFLKASADTNKVRVLLLLF